MKSKIAQACHCRLYSVAISLIKYSENLDDWTTAKFVKIFKKKRTHRTWNGHNSTAKKKKLWKYFHKYHKLRQSEVVIVHDDTFMRSLCADCARILCALPTHYIYEKEVIRYSRGADSQVQEYDVKKCDFYSLVLSYTAVAEI